MPVIRNVPNDPTDLVIQGEQLRLSALQAGVHSAGSPVQSSSILSGLVTVNPNLLVADGDAFLPMHPDFADYNSRQISPFAGTMISTGSCISTPCGAIYPHLIGNHLMDWFTGGTERWLITGVTRDIGGVALGLCSVVILESGRIEYGGMPVVAMTISDGSGNYSVEVAMNTTYRGIAYLDGSPDGSGSSLEPMTVTQV